MSCALIKAVQIGNFSSGDTYTHIRAGFVDDPGISCDTIADLPAQAGGISGYYLEQGSTAHVIADNTIYTLNSAGVWMIQDEASRMDVYTKTEIDNKLADYTTTAQQMLIDGAQDANISTLQTSSEVCKNLLAELIDSGAKNRLHFDAVIAGSLNGLTYTVNSDMSITVSGTKTNPNSASYVVFKLGAQTVYADDFADGAHVLSGCPAGGGSSTYRLYAAKGGYARYDDGNGVTLSTTTETQIQLVIIISAGYDLSASLTFKPMICSSAAWSVSKQFVPYCDTLQQLQQ